jgi:hypothetical protein
MVMVVVAAGGINCDNGETSGEKKMLVWNGGGGCTFSRLIPPLVGVSKKSSKPSL